MRIKSGVTGGVMRIGVVAERAGVSVRALRYYEEQGLVIADRNPSGHRRYPESAVARVKFIQLLYAAGLASKAIRQILPFLDTLVATPQMTRQLMDERARIRVQIDALTEAHDRLDELIHLSAQYENAPATCSAT
ncbi:MerR family transcriptional regulator [Microbispora sp. ATCC PTA-5024]|uniref:MerR family transcriptional regulator n=1 Tax=Microbispora sp. ATCC PTA-5024 TaxID=316330 RepID=UPI001E649B12|nr:MerR family transcriptional regulator [Microbispora sp. ATCC PTA-5024]